MVNNSCFLCLIDDEKIIMKLICGHNICADCYKFQQIKNCGLCGKYFRNSFDFRNTIQEKSDEESSDSYNSDDSDDEDSNNIYSSSDNESENCSSENSDNENSDSDY